MHARNYNELYCIRACEINNLIYWESVMIVIFMHLCVSLSLFLSFSVPRCVRGSNFHAVFFKCVCDAVFNAFNSTIYNFAPKRIRNRKPGPRKNKTDSYLFFVRQLIARTFHESSAGDNCII